MHVKLFLPKCSKYRLVQLHSDLGGAYRTPARPQVDRDHFFSTQPDPIHRSDPWTHQPTYRCSSDTQTTRCTLFLSFILQSTTQAHTFRLCLVWQWLRICSWSLAKAVVACNGTTSNVCTAQFRCWLILVSHCIGPTNQKFLGLNPPNPRKISINRPNPTQSNPWIDPTHVHYCARPSSWNNFLAEIKNLSLRGRKAKVKEKEEKG